MTKLASLKGPSAVGEIIGFAITVTNAGNVDLVDVTLIDSMFQKNEGKKPQIRKPQVGIELARHSEIAVKYNF